MQDKDKHRVQADVQNGADEHAEHGHQGLSLGADEGVESQGQLDENSTHQIDADVVHGVADGVFRGSKGVEDGLLKDAEARGEHHRRNQQHGGGVAQNLLRALPVPRTQADGGQRGAALSGEGGKGGDEHDDGEGHPHSGEGDVAYLGDVADIDAVHNVIQHVDDLGRHSGYRQFQHQRADGGLGQAFFVAGLCQETHS